MALLSVSSHQQLYLTTPPHSLGTSLPPTTKSTNLPPCTKLRTQRFTLSISVQHSTTTKLLHQQAFKMPGKEGSSNTSDSSKSGSSSFAPYIVNNSGTNNQVIFLAHPSKPSYQRLINLIAGQQLR